MPRSSPPRLLAAVILVLGFVSLAGGAGAIEDPRARHLKKALTAERNGAWLEACRAYDELLRKEPRNASLRDAYQRCLRRLQLVARHGDPAYRKALAKTKYAQALATLEEVLAVVHRSHPDRARADLGSLFQQGLIEIGIALSDPVFQKHYLDGVRPSAVNAFRHSVATWEVPRFNRAAAVITQVSALVEAAGKDGLPIQGPLAVSLVMEFAAGACNALDEQSCLLSPAHLALLQAASRARPACVGLRLKKDDQGVVVVAQVTFDGPAAKEGLQEGDHVLKIDGVPADKFDEEKLNEALQGKAGDVVEIEWTPLGAAGKQTSHPKRRLVNIPSVEFTARPLDATGGALAGHLRINYFTADTLRLVKEALGHFDSNPMIKGLILDLRGNPGGAYLAAVHVAELFLPAGVISVSQSPDPDHNRSYKVESPGTVAFPMVVLIDGETASAAEVLAAALKENRTLGRTVLVGQTTFGKGSLQKPVPLKALPLARLVGIRLTVAKLFSPSNAPIHGRGVTPDQALASNADLLEAAKKALADLIGPMGVMAKVERMPTE